MSQGSCYLQCQKVNSFWNVKQPLFNSISMLVGTESHQTQSPCCWYKQLILYSILALVVYVYGLLFNSIPTLVVQMLSNSVVTLVVHTLTYPLTTAKANRLSHTFLVITRQLLQLERCSNPLRIQQV